MASYKVTSGQDILRVLVLILCVGGQNRYRWRDNSQVDSPQLSPDSPDSRHCDDDHLS